MGAVRINRQRLFWRTILVQSRKQYRPSAARSGVRVAHRGLPLHGGAKTASREEEGSENGLSMFNSSIWNMR